MQEILIVENEIQINFKDGSLSINLTADELKDKLGATSEDEGEEKKTAKKAKSK